MQQTVIRELQEEGWQIKKRILLKKSGVSVFLQIPRELSVDIRKSNELGGSPNEILLCSKLNDLRNIKLEITKKSSHVHIDVEIINSMYGEMVIVVPSYVCLFHLQTT